MYRDGSGARAPSSKGGGRGRRRFTKGAIAAATLAAAGMAFAPLAGATPKSTAQAFDLPADVSLQFSADACTNNGSTIGMAGNAALGGLALEVHFKPSSSANSKLDKQAEGVLDLSVDGGQGASIPKQGASAGVGGNPYVFYSFNHKDGTPDLDNQTYLGRCVQGLTLAPVHGNIHLPATALSNIATTECSPSSTKANINASKNNQGAKGTLFFYNNVQKGITDPTQIPGVHKGQADATVGLSLIPGSIGPGHGWGVGGVGGNPYMYMRYKHAAGTVNAANPYYTDPVTGATLQTDLGRCKDLM